MRRASGTTDAMRSGTVVMVGYLVYDVDASPTATASPAPANSDRYHPSPRRQFRAKNAGSLVSVGRNTFGWAKRYSYRLVVPAFMAPITKKFGRRPGVFAPPPADARVRSCDTLMAPRPGSARTGTGRSGTSSAAGAPRPRAAGAWTGTAAPPRTRSRPGRTRPPPPSGPGSRPPAVRSPARTPRR